MIKRLVSVFLVLLLSVPGAAALSADGISADCAVVIEARTGKVLFEKNAHKKHSMASTTKIMTSLIAIESGRLPDEITVTEDMLGVEGTSMGLLPGDSVSLEELVYGMLLQSGNDAANAAAVSVAGSVEDFAGLMNRRAAEIGMKNTHFVTPSGLDDERHFSTAYDMALLGREAVRNTKFLSVCSSRSAVLSYGNPPYRRVLTNHNRLLRELDSVKGIKTGFTKKSGRCLVTYAADDGRELIAVTLGAPDDWNDHKKLLSFGFGSLVRRRVDIPKVRVPVAGGTRPYVELCAPPFIFGDSGSGDIRYRIYTDKFLYAPVAPGTVAGRADIYSGSTLLGSVDLTAEGCVGLKEVKTEPGNKSNGASERFIDFLKKVRQKLR